MSTKTEIGTTKLDTSATPLSEREFQLLLSDYNKSASSYPKDKTIVELFEAQVLRTPDDEAVRLGNRSVSYSQLNERANQMAAHLRALRRPPGAARHALHGALDRGGLRHTRRAQGRSCVRAGRSCQHAKRAPGVHLARYFRGIWRGRSSAGIGHSFGDGEQPSAQCGRSGYPG